MRDAPSFSSSGTNDLAVTTASGSQQALTALTLDDITRYGAIYVGTTASGLVAGDATRMRDNGNDSGTTPAWVMFSAEPGVRASRALNSDDCRYIFGMFGMNPLSYTYLGKESDTALPHATPVAIPWEVVEHDGAGMFDSTSPTRITIPTNVSKVRCAAQAAFETHDDNARRQIYMRKNGSEYPRGYISHTVNGGFANNSSVSFSAVSGVIDVQEGDYFELLAAQNSGQTLAFLGITTVWWLCEILE